MSFIELELSDNVNAGTQSCVESEPIYGQRMFVEQFVGEAAYNVDVAVLLVWKIGELDEQIIWPLKGEGQMPFKKEIKLTDTDQGKKLAICLDNSMSTGSVYIAGHCKVKVL